MCLVCSCYCLVCVWYCLVCVWYVVVCVGILNTDLVCPWYVFGMFCHVCGVCVNSSGMYAACFGYVLGYGLFMSLYGMLLVCVWYVSCICGYVLGMFRVCVWYVSGLFCYVCVMCWVCVGSRP